MDPQRTAEIYAHLETFPAIKSLHSVSGKIDLMVTVATRSPEQLDGLLVKIGMIPGILATESAIILSTKIQKQK